MGGVGDKAAAHLLGGLEPVGQIVELPGQLAKLIAPPHPNPVAVLAFPDGMDGSQQSAEPPGHHLGKEDRQAQGHYGNDNRDIPQGLLDVGKHLPLLRVQFVQIHRPHRHATVDHWGGGAAMEGPAHIITAEHVISPESGDHLGQQRISPLQVLVGAAVIKGGSVGVSDQHPGKARTAQHRHDPAYTVGAEAVRSGQGGGDDQGLALEGGGLGVEDRILGAKYRVGIEQRQYPSDDHHVGQGVFCLERTPKGHPPGLPCLAHGRSLLSFLMGGIISRSSNSIPRPIW